MDSLLLSSDAKSELTDFMENVYGFLKVQTAITRPTNEMTAFLENIEKQLKPTKPELQQEIDAFTFVVPNMTWADAMRLLGTTQPRQYVHFIESGNVIQFNQNAACYTRVDDPENFAEMAVRAIVNRVPPPSQQEIDNLRTAKMTEADNINRAHRTAVPDWTKLQREALPELRQEDAQLVFLDNAKKQPNWYIVVKNLKRMGEQLGYTHDHYKSCLHRFIGYYNPALMSVVQTLSANELGQYLMALTVPEPPKERLSNEMSTLVRQPGENLRQTMTQLKALATGFYSDYTPEEISVLVNRLMIYGLR